MLLPPPRMSPLRPHLHDHNQREISHVSLDLLHCLTTICFTILDVLFSIDASYPFFLSVHYPRRWRLPGSKPSASGRRSACTIPSPFPFCSGHFKSGRTLRFSFSTLGYFYVEVMMKGKVAQLTMESEIRTSTIGEL
jgi:hypothetical protein